MKERGNFWLRFLDRYAGIPILYFLSLFKQTKEKKQDVKNILVIKIGTIGDTLLLMPVLKALKYAKPEVFLSVICSKNNYEVLSRYSFIDSLRVFELSHVIKQPAYFFKFMKDINSKEYDMVIDFEPWPRVSAIVAFFVKSGYKIGFKTTEQFKHLIFDAAVPHSPNCHEIDNYISLADVAGLGADPQLKISGTSLKSVPSFKVEFPIFDSEKAFVEDLLERLPRAFGSQMKMKNHPSSFSSPLRGEGQSEGDFQSKPSCRLVGTKENENIIPPCPPLETCPRMILSGKGGWGDLKGHFREKERFDSDNLILFHPWSSGYRGHLKQWKIENFIDLAKILIEKGYWIGITGTKDNEPEAQNIVKACPDKIVSFCGRLSLGETAYLIKKSCLLITVNTGIMHIGAVLNHPMIALHGPAGVLRWGPVGSSNAYNIESNLDCAPCLNLGFEYKSPHQSFWGGDKCKDGGCMDAIKVETVLKKVYEILGNENKKTKLHSLHE